MQYKRAMSLYFKLAGFLHGLTSKGLVFQECEGSISNKFIGPLMGLRDSISNSDHAPKVRIVHFVSYSCSEGLISHQHPMLGASRKAAQSEVRHERLQIGGQDLSERFRGLTGLGQGDLSFRHCDIGAHNQT